MTDNFAKIRSLIIYVVCIPLAVFLGYLATDPLDRTSQILVGGVLFLLLLPLFMRWYHPWLIAVWNSYLLFLFLPGQLMGWVVMAVIGFGIAVGHYILNRERRFLEAPSIAWPLMFLSVVVAVTAKARGGIGLHVLGNEAIGGKRYILIWVAVMGYFALTSQAIPANKRKLMTVMFVLSGATAMISDIGGLLSGPFRYLAIFFPLSDSSTYIYQPAMGAETIERFGGFANGSVAVACALLAYYGIEQTLNLRKLWRPLVFFGALFLMTFGGFRGLLIFMMMMFGLIFCFEGLLRSKLLPVMVLGMVFVGGLALGFSDRLPLAFQRCIAFLPVKVDPVAKASAEGSTDWRLEMWKSLLPDIPRYFWLGKGLGIDAEELASYYQFGDNQVGGQVGGSFAVSGDYHSGPLSLIIQFGVWGAIGFLWFLGACLRVLWLNYKYGDPDDRRINTFLFANFIAKTLMFFFIFGGFYSDLMIFAGIIGFSVSLNGGVAKKTVAVARQRVVFDRFRPLPMPASVS